MATDYRSDIAGSYKGFYRIPMILDEGAPTIQSAGINERGFEQKFLTWATPLAYGDVVALSNDSANTFVATGGAVVVEKPVNAESLVFGRIVSVPSMSGFAAKDADANTLAERLAGEYYRTALVEVWAGINKIEKAVVLADGSIAVLPGEYAKIKMNLTGGYTQKKLCFVPASSGGVGAIPLHAVPAGTAGDQYTILVGINGLIASVTGA